MTEMIDCPVGEYCVASQTVGADCPAGTYNPVTNLKAAADCYEIPEGYYSAATGVSSIAALNDCGAGVFCPGGVID